MVLLAGGMAFGQDCLQPVGWWAYQQTNSVAVSGTTAYFGGVSADGQSPAKLMVADISNAAFPTLIGALDLPGSSVEDIAVAEPSLCLLASGDAGLKVVDVSNPAAPALVGTLDTPAMHAR
jgi:hypothetical protein